MSFFFAKFFQLRRLLNIQHGVFTKDSLYFASFREKELAAVKINAADIDIIANELEVRFTFVND